MLSGKWYARRQLTDIEPAISCDAGPILNQNWVGGSTSCIDAHTDLSVCVIVLSGVKETNSASLASIYWMLVSTYDGGGRNRPTN